MKALSGVSVSHLAKLMYRLHWQLEDRVSRRYESIGT
jgi:hypothetical protein